MFNKKVISEYIYKKNKILSLSIFLALNILFLTGCVNKNTYEQAMKGLSF